MEWCCHLVRNAVDVEMTERQGEKRRNGRDWDACVLTQERQIARDGKADDHRTGWSWTAEETLTCDRKQNGDGWRAEGN